MDKTIITNNIVGKMTVCDVYGDHLYVQSIIDYASDNNQYEERRAIIAVYGLT